MTADRVRRWPKSVGTIASLLILAAAVATTRWTVTWTCQTWGMGIWDGSFALIDPSEHLGPAGL